ncbi:DUF6192 family protein [Actinomadura terrae]|uniref:DUF6192 family protein n=1 Tax=Actinomadura terrae TaxID=604353 RepID=UPI0035578B20
MPRLGEHHFTQEERATIHSNLERVRGAAGWIEAAVDTGRVGLDAGLAALLKGE